MAGIFHAVHNGNVQELEKLIEHASKNDVNYVVSDLTSDNYGEAAIHQAAAFGSIPMTRMLLEKGTNPNLVSKDTGWGPLHWACYAGNVNICELLLKHGAGLDIKDRTGKSPTQIAVANSRFTLIRFLLDYKDGPILIGDSTLQASDIPEDVEVANGLEEVALTKKVVENLQRLFANTAPLVVEFLSRARSYGEGDATAQNYVSFMKDVMGFQNMYSMVPDIVRLLKDDDKRKVLLATVKAAAIPVSS